LTDIVACLFAAQRPVIFAAASSPSFTLSSMKEYFQAP
jgi:hypothetical protein